MEQKRIEVGLNAFDDPLSCYIINFASIYIFQIKINNFRRINLNNSRFTLDLKFTHEMNDDQR